jgi:hypothetical protein
LERALEQLKSRSKKPKNQNSKPKFQVWLHCQI